MSDSDPPSGLPHDDMIGFQGVKMIELIVKLAMAGSAQASALRHLIAGASDGAQDLVTQSLSHIDGIYEIFQAKIRGAGLDVD